MSKVENPKKPKSPGSGSRSGKASGTGKGSGSGKGSGTPPPRGGTGGKISPRDGGDKPPQSKFR
ncbi:MAG TPA: hypothetical protein VHZ53_19005 [Steroidobacteraceae bacterium]|jgi:hypothetical protein|nr:hypothetical protein [Steroidobacteraceae bacterium]